MEEIIVHHRGTMRFWGDWFGRPMDNFHTVVNAVYDASSRILVMVFDNQEECTVHSPIGIRSTENSFFIKDADSVVWSWYSYGKAHTEENRFQIQYIKENDGAIICQRGEPSHSQSVSHFNPKGFYAVEIC